LLKMSISWRSSTSGSKLPTNRLAPTSLDCSRLAYDSKPGEVAKEGNTKWKNKVNNHKRKTK
jgi:hypothetical protein